jgi:hypothetical protein
MSSKAIFRQFSVSPPAGDSIVFSLVGSKFAILFLMVFISVFSLGVLSAISSIEANDLHLIVQLLYHFWLAGIFCFLIVGWLFGIALLLGQERLIFSSGCLIVRKDLFGIGLSTYFAADSIRDFAWRADPTPSGAGAGSGTHISFRYQQETITCGTNVTSEAGEQIHQKIQQQALNEAPDADLLAKILSYEQTTTEKIAAQKLRHQTVSSAKTSPSVLALILVNALPIAGVLFLDWTVAEVMLLYWSESAVIGIFSLFKMFLINPWASLIAAPFFTLHYGGFMAAHLLLLNGFVLPGDGLAPEFWEGGNLVSPLTLAFLALFVSHGISFFQHFIGRAEYVDRDIRAQMGKPYDRIFIMQFTLIFGGLLAAMFDSTLLILLLLILLKIATDLRAHLVEHRTDLNPK